MTQTRLLKGTTGVSLLILDTKTNDYYTLSLNGRLHILTVFQHSHSDIKKQFIFSTLPLKYVQYSSFMRLRAKQLEVLHLLKFKFSNAICTS